MRYFPLFFDLNHKPVLVIGGGEVASRKVDSLLRAGADVTICLLYPFDAADEYGGGDIWWSCKGENKKRVEAIGQ